MANRNFKRKQALEEEVKDIYGLSTYTAAVVGTATLATTSPITLTQVQAAFGGVAHNGYTFHTVINAAAANPTNTILFAFTGTAAAITLTVTPNDGTNNTATPVTVTEANLVQLITSGIVTGKVPTITDASSLRTLNTATGGSTNILAHAGNGDGLTGTFSGGVSQGFSALNPSNVGITSITEVAVGTYRILLTNSYHGGLKFIESLLIGATARDGKFQVKTDGSADITKKYVDIFYLVVGTATNITNGDAILLNLSLKNTTAI